MILGPLVGHLDSDHVHDKQKYLCCEELKANGSMCTFKCVKLKNGYQDCEILNIDGYFVRCVSCDKIDYMVVTFLEGDSNRDVKLTPVKSTARANFPSPSPFDTRITNKTERMRATINITQFPVNMTNARKELSTNCKGGRLIKFLCQIGHTHQVGFMWCFQD